MDSVEFVVVDVVKVLDVLVAVGVTVVGNGDEGGDVLGPLSNVLLYLLHVSASTSLHACSILCYSRLLHKPFM